MVSNMKVDLKTRERTEEKKEGQLFDPLVHWLNKPVTAWKLLYKWTKAEKTTEAWHRQCDGKGSTVTIVWANGGYVFGGYAHLPWASTNYGSKGSPESFIFSLTDGKGRNPYQCLPYQNMGSALCFSSHFFAFGGGFDLGLYIPPQSNSSNSNLGHTYRVPEGFNGKTFLAGSNANWTIEEIETYLV